MSKTRSPIAKADVVKIPATETTESKNLLDEIIESVGLTTLEISTDDLYWRTEDNYDVLVRNAPIVRITLEKSTLNSVSETIAATILQNGFKKTTYGPSIHYLVEDELQSASGNSQKRRYAQYKKGSIGCLTIIYDDRTGLDVLCVDNTDQIANIYKPYLKAYMDYGLKKDPTYPPSTFETYISNDIRVKDGYFDFYTSATHVYGKMIEDKPIILASTQDDPLFCDFVDKEHIPVEIYDNCYTDPDNFKLRYNK